MSWKGKIKEMKDLETPEDDSELENAMTKIIKIMQEAKTGGTVFLVSETHSRYAYEFPKWSSCSIGKKGKEKGMLRMRCNSEEYESQSNFVVALENMAHFVFQLRDLHENAEKTFAMAAEKLKEFLSVPD